MTRDPILVAELAHDRACTAADILGAERDARVQSIIELNECHPEYLEAMGEVERLELLQEIHHAIYKRNESTAERYALICDAMRKAIRGHAEREEAT